MYEFLHYFQGRSKHNTLCEDEGFVTQTPGAVDCPRCIALFKHDTCKVCQLFVTIMTPPQKNVCSQNCLSKVEE